MICFMHEGSPYGHLKVGDKVILPQNLARMVGETLSTIEGWLHELQEAGVYDLTDDGVIFSRRMIRDESIRNARAQGGKLGGNPALVGGKVNHEVKQNPTPSSSSSSSSSKEEKKATIVAPPVGVSDSVWQDFVKHRKAKKAQVTQTVIDGIQREVDKAGWSMDAALRECITRNWQSFKADWVADKNLSQTGQMNQRVASGLTRGLIGGGNDVKLLGN